MKEAVLSQADAFPALNQEGCLSASQRVECPLRKCQAQQILSLALFSPVSCCHPATPSGRSFLLWPVPGLFSGHLKSPWVRGPVQGLVQAVGYSYGQLCGGDAGLANRAPLDFSALSPPDTLVHPVLVGHPGYTRNSMLSD